ncbi:MAG: glycosyltransferase [Muribaculaceae bacterium]|nr:glycosyltransferase [Muribaculaceae bacterium]
MKITIITATKNNGETLNETIYSVINQTHTDIDYIIIDGNSSDNSLDIIKQWQTKYPDKIRYISEPDNGVYNAINKGINLAEGEIIGLLHGNDYFSSSNILSQVAEKFKPSQIDMIYGNVNFVNKKGECIRYYSPKDFTPEMLNIGIAPPHPSLYLRKHIYDKYGKYKEDYIVGADFELFVRLMLIHNIKGEYLPLNMVTMRSGGLSTQFRNRIYTNSKEKYKALKENGIKIPLIKLLTRYFYYFK